MTEEPSASRGEAAGALPGAVGQPGGGAAIDLGPAPDAAEIARIEQLVDPVLRNLQISLAYCRLSREMRRLLLGPGNANWCTFATWASKRAGRTIRGEELRARIRLRLERDDAFQGALSRLNTRLRKHHAVAVLGKDHLAARVLDLVNYVSMCIAEGNLKVFAELAPGFSQMIALFDGDMQLDAE